MKKTFLAKVLAAALVITSVLPIGTINANAKPTVKVAKDQVQWMYANNDGDFTMNPSRWIDSQTGEGFKMFGDNLVVGDAMTSWAFNALESDGSGHGNLKDSGAATTVYASGIDITSKNVRRVMQFDMVKLSEAGTQFGIMLKYVDENNWVYLGYNGDQWYLEWRNGSSGDYCNAPTTDGGEKGGHYNYKDGDGESHEKWEPDFYNVTIVENKYLRIKVVYENSTNIRIAITELEESRDENGKKILVEKENTKVEDLLSFKNFGDIRTYADTAEKPIYFGFIGDKRGEVPVRVNFMNVKSGALNEKAITSQEPDTWSEALTNVSFQKCAWKSPKTPADDIEEIIKEQRLGEGVTYASIGDPEDDEKKAPNVTIYNNMVTDFAEGTIAADLRPHAVGNDKAFYLGVIESAVTAASPQSKDAQNSFKVGIHGTEWVYNLNGTETKITGNDSLPEIKAETDYSLSIKIDKAHKATAQVTTVTKAEDEGTEPETKTYELIGENSAVEVGELSGSVSLTAENEVLFVKHVTCDQIVYNKTPLEETYDTIVKANANNEFYTDIWEAFNRSGDNVSSASPQGPLSKAWDTLEGEHRDKVFSLTPQDAQANPDWGIYDELFDEGAAAVLQGEFDKINIAANKVETGRDALQRAFDKVITPGAPDAVKWYSTESLTEYTTIWNAVKKYLEETLNLGEGFAGVTKAAVEAQIEAIEEAPGKLVAKSADSEYLKTYLDPAIEEALEGIDLEDEEGNAKYYENWSEFKAAVEEAEALKADGVNPTIENVDKKIDALNVAKENLRLKTVASVTDYQSEITELTADILAEEYYKAGFDAYTDALAAANAIKAGDILKEADKKIQDLKNAIDELVLKTIADDTEGTKTIQNELNAVKTEVGGKNYVKDSNWTAYEKALAALEALLRNPSSTKTEVENALEALKEAKVKLTVNSGNTGSQDPAVGSTYVDSASGMKYTVGANQTLTLTEGNKTTKTVTIDSVTINGKAYKVTAVAANAFKGAKLTKVTFGDNVITIEKNAFSSCKSLKTVVFGKNVKTVKANAFSKCTKINTVTFQHTSKLPTIKNAFKNSNKKPKKIQVKKALIKNSKKKNAVLKQLKAAGFKKITAKNIKGKK